MSFASNLAALARLLTAAASGIVSGKAPAAGDSSTALINSAWFKAEQATEATQGTAKVATQAQTTAGSDDATIVTPKKLRSGFAFTGGTNGYFAFPTWLGGLIMQWGYYTGTGTADVVTLPLAYPNGQFAAWASDTGTGIHSCVVSGMSKTAITVYGGSPSGTSGIGTFSATNYRYLSIGY
ncbi:hypothetical protein WCQ02_20055 [Paraburkholderia tropica]|uniref:gp53-like domain-containing protein n=1 Tax=Paraburkholderia tropica TaxID=92647 RepID=UPI003017C1D6